MVILFIKIPLGDMIWCWSVDKDYILNLRYVVPNSLSPAGIIIYVTKK